MVSLKLVNVLLAVNGDTSSAVFNIIMLLSMLGFLILIISLIIAVIRWLNRH